MSSDSAPPTSCPNCQYCAHCGSGPICALCTPCFDNVTETTVRADILADLVRRIRRATDATLSHNPHDINYVAKLADLCDESADFLADLLLVSFGRKV